MSNAQPHPYPSRQPVRTTWRRPQKMLWVIAVLTVLVCALGAAFTPSSAMAAPVRECGDYPGGPGAGVFNITTRVTRCWVARRMARRFWHGRWGQFPADGSPFRRGAYTCRNRSLGYELADLRCTAPRGRVVHWQHGA